MKNLIFSGSPRKNGNSAFCTEYFEQNLNGEIKTIWAYYENISACTDCRYCTNNKICRINDNMRQIYNQIIAADKIIIISPLYFSTLTGELLSLFSRTQLFYNAKIHLKEKKGILILIGGGASKNLKPAYLTGRVILKQLGCKEIKYAAYTDTDNIPVWNSSEFLLKLSSLCKNNLI